MRRTLTLVPAVVLALAPLAGCSGGDDAAAPGERPDLPTEPPALWNPCDGLDPAAVAETFATRFTTRTGTDREPLCSFAPVTEGEPAVDVNYQLYAGTLDDLLESFGEQVVAGRTRVASPDVPGADDARVITDVNHGTLAVTGFVRNGQLVQVVNALDPSPFRRALLRDGVTDLLAPLAEHAVTSGLGGGTERPGASPSDDPSTGTPSTGTSTG